MQEQAALARVALFIAARLMMKNHDEKKPAESGSAGKSILWEGGGDREDYKQFP